MTAPWSVAGGGVTLIVRLTPKGGRDAIDGVETLADGKTVLKARVRAGPMEGRGQRRAVPTDRQGARRAAARGDARGRRDGAGEAAFHCGQTAQGWWLLWRKSREQSSSCHGRA